ASASAACAPGDEWGAATTPGFLLQQTTACEVGVGIPAERLVRSDRPRGGGCVGACVYDTIFFFQAEDGIRDYKVTGVQTCAPDLDEAVNQIGRKQDGQNNVFDSFP